MLSEVDLLTLERINVGQICCPTCGTCTETGIDLCPNFTESTQFSPHFRPTFGIYRAVHLTYEMSAFYHY